MTFRIPPPIQGLAWAAIMWALAIFSPPITYSFPRRVALVAIVAGLGILIELISVFGFIKARTTVNPINLNKSSDLVTNGFYRITRNPMYLGMLLLLLAWSLYLANPFSLLGIFGFIFVMNEIQIKPEEQALEKIFGQDYLDYKKRVRRWI